MPLAAVHGGYDGDDLAFSKVADADGRVCTVGYSKSPRVRRLELAGGWACRKVGVPEDGGCSRQLGSNAQRGARVFGGGSGGGGRLRRFGGGCSEREKVLQGSRSIYGASSNDSDRRGCGGFEAARVAMSRLGGAKCSAPGSA